MGRSRALLTETDRDRIASDPDGREAENYRYQAISRVRDRLDELEQDVVVLADHHLDLLEEVREVVCPDADERVRELQIRVEELEAERDELQEQLDDDPDPDPETATEAIGYLDTGLHRIPEETPGRTQILDAQQKLKEAIDDARHPE